MFFPKFTQDSGSNLNIEGRGVTLDRGLVGNKPTSAQHVWPEQWSTYQGRACRAIVSLGSDVFRLLRWCSCAKVSESFTEGRGTYHRVQGSLSISYVILDSIPKGGQRIKYTSSRPSFILHSYENNINCTNKCILPFGIL